MSADPDITRVVRSWLRTDEHESADRVLEDVVALLDTTPQRRSTWPARRNLRMNATPRVLLAATAVVAVVAVLGFNLLPAGGGVGGGPIASPSPASPPTPTASPSPSPAAVFPPLGALAIGSTHAMTLEGMPLTFKVPTSDWVSNGSFGLDKSIGIAPQGAGFIFWVEDTPVGVFADPCMGSKGPSLGSSAADLATAVATVPGTDLVSGPTDVTVGGRPAKHVVIKVRADVGCAADKFELWYAPTPELARYATELGSTIRVWIVDVDGTLVWIDGETYTGADTKPGQEIQQVIDSIQFE